MLFRGQVPLALTSLVGPSDDRWLSVFECHARAEGGACLQGAVLVSGGACVLREAPSATQFDVVLDEFGPDPGAVQRVMTAFHEAAQSANDNDEANDSTPPWTGGALPLVILSNVPVAVGQNTLSMVEQLGGRGRLTLVAPTTLALSRTGLLVPYDDGTSPRTTTLAPLLELSERLGRKAIRGLIGGATPGYRDTNDCCACGRRPRTAVRLFADTTMEPVPLGPAVAQFCSGCSTATLLRTG